MSFEVGKVGPEDSWLRYLTYRSAARLLLSNTSLQRLVGRQVPKPTLPAYVKRNVRGKGDNGPQLSTLGLASVCSSQVTAVKGAYRTTCAVILASSHANARMPTGNVHLCIGKGITAAYNNLVTMHLSNCHCTRRLKVNTLCIKSLAAQHCSG